MLTLIPPEEREGKVCTVCHTTKSVKYNMDIYNPETDEIVKISPVCNMCALALGLDSAKTEK